MVQPTPAAAIDCDVHVRVPNAQALLPYLDEYWQDAVLERGLNQFELGSYPPSLPIAVRPEWEHDWQAAYAFDATLDAVLNRSGTEAAILHCVSGVQGVFDEHFGSAFSHALNSWMVTEWLDKDERLRASIVVPMQNPLSAVKEIEARAGDGRFVQILMPSAADMPYGRSYYWPIYEIAEKYRLPIAIHAGGLRRTAPTSIGWPSTFIEEYASNSQAFEAQLLSMVTEGVFSKFPGTRVVLIESGFAWMPTFLWRLDKTWRGIRAEVPWVKQPPSELIREHVRITLQPIDVPLDAIILNRVIEMIGCEGMLLYSTDYPHWQFDQQPIPEALDQHLRHKIMRDNPLATYPTIRAALAEGVAP